MSDDNPSVLDSLRRLAQRVGAPDASRVSQWLASPLGRPISRLVGQIRGVMLLRDATEALEVEDHVTAEGLFMRVVGMDATRATRVMAYHGAVVSRLRLGRYQEAVQLADDAFLLLLAGGSPEALSADDRAAHDALADARKFGRWALDHPRAATDLRQRDRQQRRQALRDAGAHPDAEESPLGQSAQWPDPLQSGYRVAVHGLLAAGLVAAAADRLVPARKLLRAALYAARYDHRIERDVCWHLSRVDAELGLSEEADRHRARYEQLNERVKQTLRRLRWTN
jgi:hypothetical protein